VICYDPLGNHRTLQVTHFKTQDQLGSRNSLTGNYYQLRRRLPSFERIEAAVAEQSGSEFGKNAVFAFFEKPKCQKVPTLGLSCPYSHEMVEFN
jgi:hypothetical protein